MTSDRAGCVSAAVPVESLAPLEGIPGLRHGFVRRVAGVDVRVERAEAIVRLRPSWAGVMAGAGFDDERVFVAAGVHGDGIAVVREGDRSGGIDRVVPDVDGVVTDGRGVAVGVMVADCCALFLVDAGRRACGVVHSGRPGTGLAIAAKGIALMGREFGCRPGELLAVLSPCIRPPLYEVDFAAEIRRQCVEAGVLPARVIDARTCTGSEVERYYSYRVEKGRTGRMLAFVGFEDGRAPSGGSR